MCPASKKNAIRPSSQILLLFCGLAVPLLSPVSTTKKLIVEAEAENVKSKNSSAMLKRRLQLIPSSSFTIGKKVNMIHTGKIEFIVFFW
jgi:hypothetical protein